MDARPFASRSRYDLNSCNAFQGGVKAIERPWEALLPIISGPDARSTPLQLVQSLVSLLRCALEAETSRFAGISDWVLDVSGTDMSFTSPLHPV